MQSSPSPTLGMVLRLKSDIGEVVDFLFQHAHLGSHVNQFLYQHSDSVFRQPLSRHRANPVADRDAPDVFRLPRY